MKRFFFFLITIFYFSNFAQGQDFNYSFYPVPQYARYSEQYQPDSTGKNLVMVPDSVKTPVALLVEKTADHLVIRDQSNISVPIYSATVQFQGLLNDGKNSLLYRSTSADGESVVVNPTLGFVVISYQKCVSKPVPAKGPDEKVSISSIPSEKVCNIVNHYFGKVEFKSYKP